MHRADFDVDLDNVLRGQPGDSFGINVNFLLDHDALRQPASIPLAVAIERMGVKWLRYPGGDKSDGTLWSAPPYLRPDPTPAFRNSVEWPFGDGRFVLGNRFSQQVMDFDAFIALCRQAGAEPVIVLCYDCAYSPEAGKTAPTRNELLESAVHWARYSNIEKKYGVKYWELGNESYLKGRNNELGVLARDYARDLQAFSKALKAIDPAIRFGANGPDSKHDIGRRDADEHTGDIWWKTTLERSSEHIDYLSVHSYPCYQWMVYDAYGEHNAYTLSKAAEEADMAIRAWCSANDAARIRILLTEMNSADWYGHPKQEGWPHRSSLGHALVLFDMLGTNLSCPRVDGQMVWNTRWLKDNGNDIWDALDEKNQLLPTGLALKLWSDFCLDRLCFAGERECIRLYACRSESRLNLLVLNKGRGEADVRIAVKQRINGPCTSYLWAGNGPDDADPCFKEIQRAEIRNNIVEFRLPPVSLTIAALQHGVPS